ncbi:MAG TPA: TIM barrel protein [Candidatus Limnocylindria bacterium]|nr:TIM barrel protein [Candidatus Limnocylindria bacterium]
MSEVPGWGHQLDADRVLSEAAAVGEGAIDAGPAGFLPDRSDQARPMLKRHRLSVVAGPAQAILHHHDIGGLELAHLDGQANWLAALGAETMVLSAMPPRTASADHGIVLSSMGWAHLLHLIGSVQHVCSRHKIRLAVQPRYGSMIQGPADIERLLVSTEAGLCLDTGHLVLVGADPVEVLELGAGRIQHVHLNDIDANLALQVREYGLDYAEAISRDLYKPLGTGDASVDRVVEALRRTGYRGWYTLNQDTRLPSAEDRPLGAISRSLQHLRALLA